MGAFLFLVNTGAKRVKWFRKSIVFGSAVLSWGYTVSLFSWFVAGQSFGDRWWWLALLNTFALCLFIPLPLITLLGFFNRRRVIWGAIGLSWLLFLGLYGDLFAPHLPLAQTEGTTLTVLTYNAPFPAVGGSEEELADGILRQHADVVFLQEITTSTVQMLRRRLEGEYPYSIGETRGLVIFSKYPLSDTVMLNTATPARSAQVAVAHLQGREIVLVNAHPTATCCPSGFKDLPGLVDGSYARREHEIIEILAYLANETRPVILAGDMNTPDQTAAYRLLASQYQDSWEEAGVGFGGTFPAHEFYWHGIPFPAQLLRIDYIFHSDDFNAGSAWTFDAGASDHRGVVVRLNNLL